LVNWGVIVCKDNPPRMGCKNGPKLAFGKKKAQGRQKSAEKTIRVVDLEPRFRGGPVKKEKGQKRFKSIDGLFLIGGVKKSGELGGHRGKGPTLKTVRIGQGKVGGKNRKKTNPP